MKDCDGQVLLSYAREDFEHAVRVYRSLVEGGINVWFDYLSLLPGQRWRDVICDVIGEADLVISLLSSRSVEKKGFVQAETKMALDSLLEFPPGTVYLIPVRLDNCVPLHAALRDIHWVNLYEDWGWGLKNIKASIFSRLAPRLADHLSIDEGIASPPLPALLRYDGIYSGGYEIGGDRGKILSMRFFPGGEVVIGSTGDRSLSYDDLSLKKMVSMPSLLTCLRYTIEGERVKFSGPDGFSFKSSGNVFSSRPYRSRPCKVYSGVIESGSIRFRIRESHKESEGLGYLSFRALR